MAPNNALTIHGNEKTMNLNSLLLTNIQSSPYFKVQLFELKTYHEVIDEIYYKVSHMEPWEKGSRKTAGQTGMCGGVRGVGAGGIVSSAFCLLYKLYTLKLTRKQVIGLLTHADSPYIRAMGFLYIRYTQPPADLWEWYEEYLEDEEELDVKAGTGHVITIGEMVKQFLVKLEWYSTLFPRIPVPIQKIIQSRMKQHEEAMRAAGVEPCVAVPEEPRQSGSRDQQQRNPAEREGESAGFGEAERIMRLRGNSPGHHADRPSRNSRPSPPFNIAKEMTRDRDRRDADHHRHSRDRRSRSRERDHRRRSRSRERRHDDRHHRHRSRSHDRHRARRSRSRERRRSRSRSRDRHRHRRSRSRDRKHSRRDVGGSSFEYDLQREKSRVQRERDRYGNGD